MPAPRLAAFVFTRGEGPVTTKIGVADGLQGSLWQKETPFDARFDRLAHCLQPNISRLGLARNPPLVGVSFGSAFLAPLSPVAIAGGFVFGMTLVHRDHLGTAAGAHSILSSHAMSVVGDRPSTRTKRQVRLIDESVA